MEVIGQVRKVKAKIKDGVEKVVDRSKEVKESKKAEQDDERDDRQSNSKKDVDTIEEGLKEVEL